ncbi:MAG: sialate O-acetylesterase [Planctomycetota bacterium]
MILRLSAASLLLGLVGCQSTGKAPEPDVQTVRVVLLAGQSNMGGSGRIDDLPAELAAPLEAVPMWDLNGTGWAPMQGGPWANRKSFGPEIAFAHAVAEAGQDIRILKFSKGGTGLVHDWNPAEEGSLYHRLIGHCQAAEASLAPARVEWAGLLWMQGEQDCKDSTDASAAEAYQANLENLIARIREALDTPDLPVVIGRLHDSLGETKPHVGLDFGQYEKVRAAQVRVAEADANIEWVDTDEYPLKPDLIHFDTQGCLRLGEDFAETWLKMTAPRPGARLT